MHVKVGCAILAGHLWKSYFKLYQLTICHRQGDELDFFALLNRIREGKRRPEDIQELLTRVRTKAQMIEILREKPDMMFMFATNNEVNRFNQECVQYLAATDSIYTIKAVDVARTRQLAQVDEHNNQSSSSSTLLPVEQIPKSGEDAGGLKSLIIVGENSRVMLIRNLHTESGIYFFLKSNQNQTSRHHLHTCIHAYMHTYIHTYIGLSNGATGWLRKIEWLDEESDKTRRQQQLASNVRVVYVEFDDQWIGDEYAKTHKYKHPQNLCWIPITPMEVQYTFHSQAQTRLQLPIVLAYGIT